MTLSYTLDQINEAAAQLLQAFPKQRVFTFEGSLGAGKTTLIKALCKKLGVAENTISSPTFSIINEYLPDANMGFLKVCHMDWYRLQDEEEACQAGVEDALLDKDALCLIEWPGQAAGLLHLPHVLVRLRKVDPEASERFLEALEIN